MASTGIALKQADPIRQEIKWQKASAFRHLDESALSSGVRLQVSEASLPVLLPQSTELLQVVKVTGGKDWYAASMNADGVNVFLQGSRLAFSQPHLLLRAHPDLSDLSQETTSALRVGRGEYIASVSFNAFGLGYILEVACDEAATDPRCNQDEYILSLVRSLGIAGGKQAQP
jgi:hypothetical protein